ncbi:MAG TPA: M28 family peptidase [Vicinamibacterales bacterium]
MIQNSRLHYIAVAIAILLFPVSARAEISTDEKALLARIDVTRALAMVRHLSQEVVTTSTGAGKGTAVAGSAEEKALADVIERELRSAGLAVRQEPFPVRHYQYGPVALTVNGQPIEAISLHAGGGTWGERDGVPYRRGNENNGQRVRGELVDAGDGAASDYARAGDLRGKVVLVRRGGAWPTYQILEAAHHGAAALLLFDYPGSREDTLKQDSMWYHEQLPMASITRRDGERLKGLAAGGRATITLENRIDVNDGQSQNVVAMIRGSELPDEWIAVTAHYDRWFTGAQDNSVGAASMIELAKVFAGSRPRRSLLFMAMGGEESGIDSTESDWLAGSHAFVTAHPDITRRLAFSFNIDGAGWPGQKGYLHATIDNVPFQRQILTDLGLADRLDVRANISSNVDGWNRGIVGGGAIAYVSWREARPDAPDLFAPLYHTQADVFDPSHFTNLIHDLSVGALGILRTDRAPLLPIAMDDVASWVARSLEADAARAPDVSFDAATRASKAFTAASAQASAAGRTIAPADRTAWNLWLMRTRKDLMPWLLSRGGGGGLKTGAYVGDVHALATARAAAEQNDRAATTAALEQAGGIRQAARYSPEVAEAERLYWYTSGDWSIAYEQKARPLSLEALAVYRRLAAGGDLARELPVIRQLEAEARSHLSDALFLVTGKLNAATAALQSPPPHATASTGGAR